MNEMRAPVGALAEPTTLHPSVRETGARKIALLRVLGPGHVWALGVGIVLVGEFMGWNFAVGKGGPVAALTACWLAGILYTCVAMIDSEITSTVAAAGGQYAQAKHIIGPLAAFNVGLYLVMAYTMLEVSNAIVAGDLIEAFATNLGLEGSIDKRAFMVLTVVGLAFLNYRGVLATLTLNLVITAAAFAAIVVLFVAAQPWAPGAVLKHGDLLGALPYGSLGILAAMHFGLWFYLGIEGTTQAAEEVRSPARALPLGTMAGMMTLLIAATITWYVCTGLMPWEYLGQAVTPLYDAARLTGNRWLELFLFLGTLFATIASANGCINDASRAWFTPPPEGDGRGDPESEAPPPPAPNAVTGPVRVVDTATLRVGGKIVHLFGVEWVRGGQAEELARYIAGRPVVCQPAPGSESMTCQVDGRDLSEVVLYNGGGRASPEASPELVAAEDHARSERLGVWKR